MKTENFKIAESQTQNLLQYALMGYMGPGKSFPESEFDNDQIASIMKNTIINYTISKNIVITVFL